MQKTFAPIYGFDKPELFANTFDAYLKDDEKLQLGEYEGQVIHLPGHTPDHVGYVFGKAIFTGDSMFNVSYTLSDIYPPYAQMTISPMLVLPE